MLVEQNALVVEEREREIRQIVQSISDLNEIFRDLGAMIVEQVPGPPSCPGLGCRHVASFCRVWILPSYRGAECDPRPPRVYVRARAR